MLPAFFRRAILCDIDRITNDGQVQQLFLAIAELIYHGGTEDTAKRVRRAVTATVRLHKDDSGFFIDATLDAELAGVRQ